MHVTVSAARRRRSFADVSVGADTSRACVLCAPFVPRHSCMHERGVLRMQCMVYFCVFPSLDFLPNVLIHCMILYCSSSKGKDDRKSTLYSLSNIEPYYMTIRNHELSFKPNKTQAILTHQPNRKNGYPYPAGWGYL